MTAGRSILQMLWDEMDAEMSDLMLLVDEGAPTEEKDLLLYVAAKAKASGVCLGIAKCIAIMTNPYDPDVDAVRRETKERYEQA